MYCDIGLHLPAQALLRVSHENRVTGNDMYLANTLPDRWIECQFQAPLHMGAAELSVHCRLHWKKESIKEMWRSEIY